MKKNAVCFDIDFDNIKTNNNPPKNQSQKEGRKVEVIPNEEDPKEAAKEQVLYQCPNCGRKFKREAYAKHVPICSRVFQGKKEIENPKMNEIKEKMENPTEKKSKGLVGKAKWEKQSNELRAIIQSKRAEKEEEKKEEIKASNNKNNNINGGGINNNDDEIVVLAKTKPSNIDKNGGGAINNVDNNKALYTKDANGFLQCELCHKKFTKMNFESHLMECKQKYKDKKASGFVSKPAFASGPSMGSPAARRPMMPAVNYGGFGSKPKLNLKFGK